MRANNDSGGQYGTPIITDYSLLKIKEKLKTKSSENFFIKIKKKS